MAFMTKPKQMQMPGAVGAGERASTSAPARTQSALEKWTRKIPAAAYMPLLNLATAAILLAVMLPVFTTYVHQAQQQDEPYSWPAGMSEDDKAGADMMNLDLDLLTVDPDAREVTFLMDLSPGGTYEHADEEGVLDLGGLDLTLKLGNQVLEYASGTAVSDFTITWALEDAFPLYQYPFDEYTLTMVIRAALLNTTDKTTLQIPVGLRLEVGKQGWDTMAVLSEATNKNGVVPGVAVTIDIKRSGSVKFFSLFVILMMWAISLGVFVISLNYVFSDSPELAFDVPSLTVGLLFALPFVRDIQPDVPTLGITVDIMGFFFNMILIAFSTVMTMAALSSRYRRSLQVQEGRVAPAPEEVLQGGSSISGAPPLSRDSEMCMVHGKGNRISPEEPPLPAPTRLTPNIHAPPAPQAAVIVPSREVP